MYRMMPFVVMVAVVAGCSSNSSDECSSDSDCPSSLVCEQGFCVRPASSGPDGSSDPPEDSGQVDASDTSGGTGDTGDTVESVDTGARPDSACEPQCGSRTCGEDPRCGISCGTCSGIQACNAGSCQQSETYVRASINGTQVVAHTVGEATYDASEPTLSVRMKNYEGDAEGSGFSLEIRNSGRADSFSTNCQSSTSDENVFAEFTLRNGPDVPAEWAGPTFESEPDGCSGLTVDDAVESFDVTVSKATSDRIQGSFSLKVQGAGPRSGDTLTADGAFSLEPETK